MIGKDDQENKPINPPDETDQEKEKEDTKSDETPIATRNEAQEMANREWASWTSSPWSDWNWNDWW